MKRLTQIIQFIIKRRAQAKLAGYGIEVLPIPPTATNEDAEYAAKLAVTLGTSPTATDDYRDPPPPWVR